MYRETLTNILSRLDGQNIEKIDFSKKTSRAP